MELSLEKSIESLHTKADKAALDNAIIMERLGSVQTNIRELREKVVRHDVDIESLKVTDTQLLGHVGTLLAGENERKVAAQKRSSFWTERLVWAAGLIIFAVLQASGVLRLGNRPETTQDSIQQLQEQAQKLQTQINQTR